MKKIFKYLIPVCVLLLAVIIAGAVIVTSDGRIKPESKEFLDRLSVESYDTLWVSLFDTVGFNTEDFEVFLAEKMIKCETPLSNMKEVNSTVDAALSNGASKVYIGLDPDRMNVSVDAGNILLKHKLDKKLIPAVCDNPDVKFVILLPWNSLDSWMARNEKSIRETVAQYAFIAQEFLRYDNVTVKFPGRNEWLIRPEMNYNETGGLNEGICDILFVEMFATFADDISSESVDVTMGEYLNFLIGERTNPTQFKDLSGSRVLFIGDSFFAKDKGVYSIPDVFAEISKAECFNLGAGGIAAVDNSEGNLSFGLMLDSIDNENLAPEGKDTDFESGFATYSKAGFPKDISVVFINFGLNDFFTGAAIDESEAEGTNAYKTALCDGINRVKEMYPEAEIILVGPTYTPDFEGKEDTLGEFNHTIADFANASRETAEKLGIKQIDSINILNWDMSNFPLYLSDMVHPNEATKYELAKMYLDYVGAD
ncbi:MAG: SGNH/GDSL hydrolase family protein [Lachnospiraceae bacterium]|nr:SGNH/GDSL hydrolase family protein [Lachnospiraceae bacterium]